MADDQIPNEQVLPVENPPVNAARWALRPAFHLAATLVIYLGLAGFGAKYFALPSDRQTWIVFLTGAALVWYAWETMLLRRTGASQVGAMEKQRALMALQLPRPRGSALESYGKSSCRSGRSSFSKTSAPRRLR